MRRFTFLATRFAVIATTVSLAATVHAAPPTVGQPAPAFTVNTLDGNAVSLEALTHDGPAVVVVLRGWPGYQCPICTKQVASFRAKADAFRAAGVPVLMIYPGPADGLKAHADDFLKGDALPAGFRLAIDPDYAFTNAWSLRWDKKGETAHPSTFVVDAQGVVRFAKVSETHGDRATPDAALKAAIAAKATTQPTTP